MDWCVLCIFRIYTTHYFLDLGYCQEVDQGCKGVQTGPYSDQFIEI